MAEDPLSREQLDQATRAAWLSYIGGYTQAEVARRLQISSAKAHRLIALAHKHNLVKVFIEGEPANCVALEEAILSRFNLRTCIVAPSVQNEADSSPLSEFAAVGAAGARFLHKLLSEQKPEQIGVGKGRSLSAVVERMPTVKMPDLKLVSVSGSLTRKLSTNPFDVIHRLVERTGGEGFLLPVPYIATDEQEKQMLMGQPTVKDMLDVAKNSELYVIGIGSLEHDAHICQVNMIDDDEWQALNQKGAASDVMGQFIDIDGQPVASEVNRRGVGLTIEDIRGRQVVAVIGGDDKGKAAYSALNTGIITDLIIGEASAESLVSQINQ
mgnify:CR=1 FL=1